MSNFEKEKGLRINLISDIKGNILWLSDGLNPITIEFEFAVGKNLHEFECFDSFFKEFDLSRPEILPENIRMRCGDGFFMVDKLRVPNRKSSLPLLYWTLLPSGEENDNLWKEHRRFFLESLPSGVFIFHRNTQQILEVNEAALKLYGFSRSEFLSYCFSDLRLIGEPYTVEDLSNGARIIFERHWTGSGSQLDLELQLCEVNFENLPAILVLLRDRSLRLRTEKENQYLAYLINCVSDAVIAIDENQIVTSWNKGAELLYGFTSEEAIGQTFGSLVHTEFIHDDLNESWKTLNSNGVWRGEVKQTGKYNQTFHVQSTVSKLIEPSGAVAVNRDISDRNKIQEALSKSEERYRNLVVKSSGLTLILSPEKSILFASPSMLSILGTSETDLSDMPFDLGIHPNDRIDFNLLFESILLAKGQRMETSFRYMNKKGHWVFLEVELANHLDVPALNGIVLTIQDVSHKHFSNLKTEEDNAKMRELIWAYGYKMEDILSKIDAILPDLQDVNPQSLDKIEEFQKLRKALQPLKLRFSEFMRQ